MSPSDELPELAVLGIPSPMETMILALVHPVIRVYKVRGFGQYKGGKLHVINFPQESFISFLASHMNYQSWSFVYGMGQLVHNAREQQTLVRDGGRGPSVRNGLAIVQAARGLAWGPRSLHGLKPPGVAPAKVSAAWTGLDLLDRLDGLNGLNGLNRRIMLIKADAVHMWTKTDIHRYNNSDLGRTPRPSRLPRLIRPSRLFRPFRLFRLFRPPRLPSSPAELCLVQAARPARWVHCLSLHQYLD
ncbi:hypothetical protein L211DRAFT_849464 [Terfezia boudieri ATCC MYA-4762]|uniref:Uncharacterized protein n=1 Tax=Terfezia boudieri ATCC MYA-4762 TaxID=1051890 RepID=A0A3N4LT91_9PEZI|nr:hypothetical protein L211DRAFT_849464 [Terfezia boudieri ATCC MYA-4762]